MPTEHRHQLGTLDVALLLHTLAQRGIDIEVLLAGAGLESLDWQNPNGKLTYADKLSIFSVANQSFPHDGTVIALLRKVARELTFHGVNS